MSDNVQKTDIQPVEDDFGLDEEFAFMRGGDASQIPPSGDTSQPDADTQVSNDGLIEKTFDLGDGSTVTIRGESEAAVYEKAMEEQRRYLEEKALFDTDNLDFPDPPKYEPIPDPTPDDYAAAILDLKDPVKIPKAIARLFELEAGVPMSRIKQINAALQDMEMHAYGEAVGNAFVRRHLQFDNQGNVVGGDYYPSEENFSKIIKYMQNQGIEYSLKGVERAFRETKKYLEPFPDDFGTSNEDLTAPTGLSASMNSDRSSENRQSVDEMLRWMDTASEEELDKWAAKQRRYR